MAIRVGIIGLNHGANVHVPSYRLNTRYEVAAVCARTPDKVQAYAQTHNIPFFHTDARQLLRAGLDLISIASPPATHAGLAAAALAAGKHVVVEVGFTPLEADARVLMQMNRERRRVGAAAFVLRYAPSVRQAGDLMAAGRIGPPRLMRFDYQSSYLAGGQERFRWFWDGANGGGVLNNNVAHAVDLAMQWFGPVEEVQAHLARIGQPPPAPEGISLADDTGALTLTFAGGQLALFTFSAAVAVSRATLELHGSEGALLMDGFGEDLAYLPLGSDVAEAIFPDERYLEATRGRTGLRGGFVGFVNQLAEAIDGRPAPGLPTFEDGWQVTRVLEAARLSHRERRRVRLAELV